MQTLIYSTQYNFSVNTLLFISVTNLYFCTTTELLGEKVCTAYEAIVLQFINPRVVVCYIGSKLSAL